MTTESVGKPPRFTSTFLATAAIACFAYSVFVLLMMHVLRPDYAPASHMISEYALGRSAVESYLILEDFHSASTCDRRNAGILAGHAVDGKGFVLVVVLVPAMSRARIVARRFACGSGSTDFLPSRSYHDRPDDGMRRFPGAGVGSRLRPASLGKTEEK